MNTTARLLRTLPVLAAATTVFVLPVTTSSASAAPHTVSSAISDKSKPKPALVDTGKCTQGGSDETHANMRRQEGDHDPDLHQSGRRGGDDGRGAAHPTDPSHPADSPHGSDQGAVGPVTLVYCAGWSGDVPFPSS